MNKSEITYYKFYSEIRNFLSKLLSNPIKSEITNFFKENDFTKEKLIHALIKRGILNRKEHVKDRTNSEEEKTTYYVKYSINKQDFESKIKKMFNEYFKQNINEMSKVRHICITEAQLKDLARNFVKEATTCGSVGGETTRGDMGYDVPAFAPSKDGKGKKNNKFFKDSLIRKPGMSVEQMD